jgi:hypothetical protein
MKMNGNRNNWHRNIPAKGGLAGALLGALVSFFYHRPQDKPLKNAGKTAIFSGLGFLLGNWIERLFKKGQGTRDEGQGTRDEGRGTSQPVKKSKQMDEKTTR